MPCNMGVLQTFFALANDIHTGVIVPAPPLTLNASVQRNAFSAATFAMPAITTTIAPTILVITGSLNNAAITSITSSGLTWQKRGGIGSGFGTYNFEIWWAAAPSLLTSHVVTVNTTSPGSDYAALTLMAVSGVNMDTPWDTNASLTATGAGGSALIISTDASDTFIIGGYKQQTAAPTAGSGFTTVSGVDFILVEYKIVSSPQTNLSVALGTFSGNLDAKLADALVRASGSGGGSSGGSESADDTSAAFGDPPIINSIGEEWTITAGQQVAVNTGSGPVTDGTTANVILLYYTYNFNPHRIYHENASSEWYYKAVSADTWIGPVADPRPGSGTGSGNIVYNPGSTVPTVGSGSNSITVNLTSATGAICNKAVWGTATSVFASGITNIPGRNAAWVANYLVDPVFQSQVSALGLKFIRMNYHTLIRDIFGNGTTSINPATPDWRVIAPMTGANTAICFPDCEFAINGINNTDPEFDIVGQKNTIASCYAVLAQRFKDQGLYIKYWEPMNEPNNTANYDNVEITDFDTAVRIALHNVDPTFVVGTSANSFAEGDLLNKGATAGAQAYNFHSYFEAGGQQNISDDLVLNQYAVDMGNSGIGARTDVRSAPGHSTDNPLLFLTEWNMNLFNGVDTRQDNYIGAVFQSIVRIHGAYSGLCALGHWRLDPPDGHYAILSYLSNFVYSPPAYMIKAQNQYMPAGNVRTMTINRTSGNKMSALTVTDDTSFGMIIANRDTSVSWTGSITLNNRVSSANLTRFILNSANVNGATASITQASLSSVTIPAIGVMIISGLK